MDGTLAGNTEAPVTTPFVLNPGTLTCSANPGSLVTDDYASPLKFTGTIQSAQFRRGRHFAHTLDAFGEPGAVVSAGVAEIAAWCRSIASISSPLPWYQISTHGWSCRLRPTPGRSRARLDPDGAEMVSRSGTGPQQNRRAPVDASRQHDPRRPDLDQATCRFPVNLSNSQGSFPLDVQLEDSRCD